MFIIPIDLRERPSTMLLPSSALFNIRFAISVLAVFLLQIGFLPLYSHAGQWDILPETGYQQPYVKDEQTGETILLSPNRNPADTNTAEDNTFELKRTIVKLHNEYEQVARLNFQLKEALEAQNKQPATAPTIGNHSPEKLTALTSKLSNLSQENQQLQVQLQRYSANASQWQHTATAQEQLVQTLQQKVGTLLQENKRLMQRIATQQQQSIIAIPLKPNNATPTTPIAIATVATSVPPNFSAETKQLKETIAQLKVENEALHRQVTSGLSATEPAQAHSKLTEATLALKQAFQTIQDQNKRITTLKEKIDSLQSLQLSQTGEMDAIGLSAIENAQHPNTKQEISQSTSELQQLKTQLQGYEQTITQLKTQLQKQASVVMLPTDDKNPTLPSGKNTLTTNNNEAKTAQLAYEQGLEKETQQQWNEALQYYQQALQLQPKQPYYQLALARAYLQQEQTPQSIQLLETLQQQPSIQAEVATLLGKAYLNQKDKVKAQNAYHTSFHPKALSNYAMLLKQEGTPQALQTGEAFLKVAIHLHPNDANLHYNLGNLYVANKQIELASNAYKMAIDLNPKLSKAYYNLGLLEADKANNAQAKQYFQTYLELEPNASNKTSVEQTISSL
jgi:tetratricopeptide (TPR) repeat protein